MKENSVIEDLLSGNKVELSDEENTIAIEESQGTEAIQSKELEIEKLKEEIEELKKEKEGGKGKKINEYRMQGAMNWIMFPDNSYAEDLTPSTSECDFIWK